MTVDKIRRQESNTQNKVKNEDQNEDRHKDQNEAQNEAQNEDQNEAQNEAQNEDQNEVHRIQHASPGDVMMTQPGMTAAMVGGAVVVLLYLALLTTFIVYIMRMNNHGLNPFRCPPTESYRESKG